jgi:pyruvate-formate lyase-activating enzyme
MMDTPDNPNKERIASVLSILASAVPTLGGPVSAILNGYVTRRKFDRMAEVINQLADDLKDFQNEASKQFVATDDFEDLLDDTLRRVASERNEEKRKVFKNLLRETIKGCDTNYDEHLRILRAIEQIQPDHILLLNAINQIPDKEKSTSSTRRDALQRRLRDFETQHLTDLVEQLDDLRLTHLLPSFGRLETPENAENLKSMMTLFGRRLMKYINEEP